jgi:hypothetical protein
MDLSVANTLWLSDSGTATAFGAAGFYHLVKFRLEQSKPLPISTFVSLHEVACLTA